MRRFAGFHVDAAGLRRVFVQCSSGQAEARGRRQRLHLGSLTAAAAASHGLAWPLEDPHGHSTRSCRSLRACLSILELCERFRDSSQASGASQRVQRAPVASLLEGCDGWPCTPWPSRGRSRGVTLLWVVPHLPSARERLSGSRERAGRLFYRASAVRVRSGVVSCLFCAVRRAWPAGATRDGVDSLCAGSGASRFGAARPVPAARARIFPEDRRACDPNP